MVLLPHIIVGAVIGSKIDSFGLVALLAIIFHFILDQIPHWDYLTYQDAVDFKKNKKIKIILKTSIDVIAGLIVFFVCVFNHQLDFRQIMLVVVGIFFSVLPDFIWGLSMIFNNKIFSKYRDFNNKINYKSQKEGRPTFLELFTQIIVIAIALLLLFVF
ncbi:MAG: hypothetical protein V1686_00160 [Patescibacteria group bacterium]